MQPFFRHACGSKHGGVCCIDRARVMAVGPTEEAGHVRRPRTARPHVDRSAFAGFRFPPEVITVAVRWYLRYGLSYRDGEDGGRPRRPV